MVIHHKFWKKAIWHTGVRGDCCLGYGKIAHHPLDMDFSSQLGLLEQFSLHYIKHSITLWYVHQRVDSKQKANRLRCIVPFLTRTIVLWLAMWRSSEHSTMNALIFSYPKEKGNYAIRWRFRHIATLIISSFLCTAYCPVYCSKPKKETMTWG